VENSSHVIGLCRDSFTLYTYISEAVRSGRCLFRCGFVLSVLQFV